EVEDVARLEAAILLVGRLRLRAVAFDRDPRHGIPPWTLAAASGVRVLSSWTTMVAGRRRPAGREGIVGTKGGGSRATPHRPRSGRSNGPHGRMRPPGATQFNRPAPSPPIELGPSSDGSSATSSVEEPPFGRPSRLARPGTGTLLPGSNGQGPALRDL